MLIVLLNFSRMLVSFSDRSIEVKKKIPNVWRGLDFDRTGSSLRSSLLGTMAKLLQSNLTGELFAWEMTDEKSATKVDMIVSSKIDGSRHEGHIFIYIAESKWLEKMGDTNIWIQKELETAVQCRGKSGKRYTLNSPRHRFSGTWGS